MNQKNVVKAEDSAGKRLCLGAALFVLTSSIAGCGGGGGGGGGGTVQPPAGSGWQSGVFLDRSTFAAKCAAPRSGTDPATGAAYPDVQGGVLDENNFLRSHANDTYLWYNEITDRDPSLYNDPLDYFDLLKTTATTPSGQDKDKFHFTYDSMDYYQLSQAGVTAGYGAQFVLLSALPPREVRVVYTEPNSPASNASLQRGASILAVDGFDIDVNTDAGIDALNEGLFDPAVGSTHSFVVEDVGGGSRTINMTAADVTSAPVQGAKVIDTPTGRVGYMLFNDHILTAERALIDAVDLFNTGQGIDDLVLDVRYNGGGYLFIASQLAYMIAGDASTAGRRFELSQFNNKHPADNPVTGDPIDETPFYNVTSGFDGEPANEFLPTLDLPRVFVLTGPGTCSASEAIINSLRGIDVEVIQIGSTTCGKPYGFYPEENCGTTYFTIQFRGINEKGFGDYTDGFSAANQPSPGTTITGCSVADDLETALGDPSEARLAAALDYRVTGSCPSATGSAPGGISKPGVDASRTDGVLVKSPVRTNRIMLDWPQ